MKNNTITISLIVPCYNEENNIQKGVLDKIGNYTKDDVRFKQVIIVDDGSTDDSKNIIKTKYLKSFPKFKLLENNHQGKAFAIMRGINESTSDYTIFSDIDLATPIEEAEKLIHECLQGYKIVIGSRKLNRRGAPLTRKILSLGAIFIRDYVIGIKNVHDTQCGFKMFKTSAAVDIIKRQLVFKNATQTKGPSVSAGFDMEFLFIASRLGYEIKEVPVVWKHVENRSVSFFKDAKESVKDIMTIKLNELRNKYDLTLS